MKIKKYFNRYNKITVILMMFNLGFRILSTKDVRVSVLKKKGAKYYNL